MQTYEILVQNRAIKGNSKDMTLVRTSVGIDQVHILFDSTEWLDFPVTITFAQGDILVTQSLLLTSVDSSDWVAEASVTVPYEVINMTGPIRVTVQGTDSQGRHIITAKGSPLSVEESGDVVIGDIPASAPTIDQWQQAYSQAMAAANAAQSVANSVEAQVASMIADAEERIIASIGGMPIASKESLGGVIVGANLNVDETGRIWVADIGKGMTTAQEATLVNLSNLAYYCFDTEFDARGTLKDNVKVKRSVIPLAGTTVTGIVMVDNDTILVDAEGRISSPRYVLPVATSEELGGVMIGNNITIDEGVIGVPVSTSESLGVVMPDGVTITIDDGVLTATGGGGDGGGYILPKAAANQLGGIKVGDGLAVDSDGVLSIDTGVADWMVF